MSTDYVPRELARPVAEALDSLPVVVVTGLRQAGKTTFLQRDPSFRGRRYLSFDDFATLEAARRDPEGLIEGGDPLCIDEAQRCPELLLALKRTVDRDRRPGRFLLTGSANLALLRRVFESLAGRALYLVLDPFTRREKTGAPAEPPFLTRFLDEPRLPRNPRVRRLEAEDILQGGLPAVALGQVPRPDLWFRGYEQTYLERDLRDLAPVADLVAFRRFLRLAALRTGQLLNVSGLARDAQLSTATASRYLGLLEASFVVTRVPTFLRSRVSRLVKAPKLFVTDSGLACHLVGAKDLRRGAEEPLRGALLETYVAQNLAAILRVHRPDAELAFWHVQGRHEVDFVIAERRSVVGIEVKAASRFDDRDLAGLRSFLAHTPEARAGLLAYDGTEAVSLGDRLYAVPLGLMLA
ncbi:MAG: ATP-binding protein [Planctomycetota bacterium]